MRVRFLYLTLSLYLISTVAELPGPLNGCGLRLHALLHNLKSADRQRPAIGVMLEASNGKRYMVFGSYTGSKHHGLLSFAQEVFQDRMTIKWMGEAILEAKPNGLNLVSANESSGLYAAIREVDGPIPLLEDFKVDIEGVEALRLISKNINISDVQLYPYKTAVDKRSIRTLAGPSAQKTRHDMGNIFVSVKTRAELNSLTGKNQPLRPQELTVIKDAVLAFEQTSIRPITLNQSDTLKSLKRSIDDYLKNPEATEWSVDQWQSFYHDMGEAYKILYFENFDGLYIIEV